MKRRRAAAPAASAHNAGRSKAPMSFRSFGIGRASRARPDGYTIDLGFLGSHVLNGALYSLPYDVLNDFAPISPLAVKPFVVFARKTMPAKDLEELIVWLKANPNKASAGITTGSSHVLTAFFRKETGTQFTLVPYRGGSARIQDLVAGRIDLLFAVPDYLPLMRAESIEAYAVTSDTRLTLAPDIPTVGEMRLPALFLSEWFGLFAPRGTPRDIILGVTLTAQPRVLEIKVAPWTAASDQ
jgi:tripartite-type tricarboxylate transporter receptor subunit TctC